MILFAFSRVILVWADFKARLGDLPVKLATKNQLEISIGRKEARWSVCISDIDPAKIMSQLCHSCGI